MIIGHTIVAEDSNDTVVLTPWFPRLGNSVSSTFEVIAISADAELDVQLLHKNSEDTGEGSVLTATGTTSRDTTGVTTFLNDGCKELVRYRITLTRTSGTGAVYCHFRILSPSWQTTGAQSI